VTAGPAVSRAAGSTDEFEREWAEALRTRDPRWFTYPDRRRGDQVSLQEWVKARQVLSVLRRHGVTSGTVLEYGCGSAGMAIFLREHGYRAHGADLSERALTVAQINDRTHRPAGPPLPLYAANSLALPLADGAYDATMSFGLLEHFESSSLDALLREVVRVTRPGGVFVADIIPARLNARALGNAVNAAGATLAHALGGRWADARAAPGRYFGHYYETSTGPEGWAEALRRHGLRDVRVDVCRPFPPLAISGMPERLYVELMRSLLPLWRRFDGSSSALARRWGWMYLASGVHPA
jgi:SAM-dependent methyltransferase